MNEKNIEINVGIRGPCNYSCYYCIGNNEKQSIILLPLEKIKKIYDSTSAFIVTSLECGSGEPALHPQITDLLRIFITKGMVSIPTNNSIKPNKWLPQDSKKIFLRAALHPQNEKNLDDFIERLLEARGLGASVRVEFVAHPERISSINKYMEILEKHKIEMAISGFMGTHNRKLYPDSYTDEEKKKIGLIHTDWYTRINLDIIDRNFLGISCLAGHSLIYVTPKGEIQRCLYDKQPIEAIFDNSQPCKMTSCGCGLHLEKLNNQGVAFWNYWRGLAGLPLLAVPSSENKSDEDLYKEKKEIYKTLRDNQ
jgi:organic radical activating enzyme